MDPRKSREFWEASRMGGGFPNRSGISSYADEEISLPQTLPSPGSEIIADHHDDITTRTGVELKLLKTLPLILAILVAVLVGVFLSGLALARLLCCLADYLTD